MERVKNASRPPAFQRVQVRNLYFCSLSPLETVSVANSLYFVLMGIHILSDLTADFREKMRIGLCEDKKGEWVGKPSETGEKPQMVTQFGFLLPSPSEVEFLSVSCITQGVTPSQDTHWR
jgi:hypothetical protein